MVLSPTISFNLNFIPKSFPTYDHVGSRVAQTSSVPGFYDTIYAYDADGYLQTKTTTDGVTSYTYDTRGALRAVALPDGRTVEYVIDPLGRRIAKKINGVVQEKYLWQGMTRLLAVYDDSDDLKYRFQYAGGRMPVSV